MAEFFKNLELCANCPMGQELQVEPVIVVEIGWVANADISLDGRTASFEMEDGKPVGERLSTLAVIDSGDEPITGNAVFKVSGTKFDNGDVKKAFKECAGPTERKGGFLWLQNKVGCTAVKKLQEK